MSKPSEKREENQGLTDAAGFAGGLASVLSAPNLSAATDQVFRDAGLMGYWLSRYAGCAPDKLQGRAFEFLETLKFNERAARLGSELRASTTQMKTPTGPVDIEILKGPNQDVVAEVQAKSYGDPSASIRALASDRYRGQVRLVPSDQEAAIRERLTGRGQDHLSASGQEEVLANLKGRLEHDGVASPGTTRWEADFAAKNRELAVLALEGKAVLSEVGSAAKTGALASGGLALAFSTMVNAAQVASGSKEPAEATIDTLRGAASASVRGGSVAGAARAIAILGRQQGFTTFASGAAPVVIANTTFEVAHCTAQYLRGETDGETLWRGSGAAVLRATTAYYCAVVGQLVIPVPVAGGLIGSLVGYTTASVLLQAGMLGIGASDSVEAARRTQVERSCQVAIARMAECRIAIEELTADQDLRYREAIVPALDKFELELIIGDGQSAIDALAQINLTLGQQLPFADFPEFDSFMLDPLTTLQL